MRSSTSNSEPAPGIVRWIGGIALSLALWVGVAVACVRLGAPGASAPWAGQAALDGAPQDGTAVVVLGSSISLAAVDPAVTATAAGLGAGEVVQLSARGTQPAHWVAVLRHRLAAQGRRIGLVVLVSPLTALAHGELRTDADRAALLALMTAPDADLSARALGSDGSGVGIPWVLRGRAALGARLRGAVTRTLPALFFGEAAWEGARAAASPIPGDPAQRPAPLVGQGTRGRSEVLEPEALPPEASFLPDLIGAVAAVDGRLLVVAPPVHPEQRIDDGCRRSAKERAILDWLAARDVAVLDLSAAPIPARFFRTRYHVEGEGTRLSSQLIGDAVRTVFDRAEQGGWRHAPGCASGPR